MGWRTILLILDARLACFETLQSFSPTPLLSVVENPSTKDAFSNRVTLPSDSFDQSMEQSTYLKEVVISILYFKLVEKKSAYHLGA